MQPLGTAEHSSHIGQQAQTTSAIETSQPPVMTDALMTNLSQSTDS
jgi:hypothetical protein